MRPTGLGHGWNFAYVSKMVIDYVTNMEYKILPSSFMEGRLPETVLKGGAGSGVLRPRLVTAGSGGPGHRLWH